MTTRNGRNQNAPRLSATHRSFLGRAEAELHVGAAALWEISVKRAAGTLAAPADLSAVVARVGCRPLALSWQYLEWAGGPPPRHGDPFDRLRIAQSRFEQIAVISSKTMFDRYGIERL